MAENISDLDLTATSYTPVSALSCASTKLSKLTRT
jgi:hypothetical protein